LSSKDNAAASVRVRSEGDDTVYSQRDASSSDNFKVYSPNSPRDGYAQYFKNQIKQYKKQKFLNKKTPLPPAIKKAINPAAARRQHQKAQQNLRIAKQKLAQNPSPANQNLVTVSKMAAAATQTQLTATPVPASSNKCGIWCIILIICGSLLLCALCVMFYALARKKKGNQQNQQEL